MRQLDVPLGQFAQSTAPHQREIDRRCERAQRMIGADIRSRAFAANMLLARIERQAERATAVAIASLSDQPAGHLAQMSRARGHEADAGSAELKRLPETLTLTHGNIDAKLARRADQPERDTFGSRGDCERARAMRCLSNTAKRLDDPESIWIAGDSAQQSLVRDPIERGDVGGAGRVIEWNFDDLDSMLSAQVGANGRAIVGPQRSRQCD